MYRTIASIVLFSSILARADHFSGSSITYECLGGSQYKIFLDLYLDCAGSPMIGQSLQFSSSCGTNFTLTDLLPIYTEDISPVCAEEADNTSCNGGTLPGFRHHHFEVITFLSPCNFWNIHWSICCRNTMVNIQNLPGLYVNATVDTSGGFCDASPKFTDQGVPFVCVNSTMHYNAGVIDPDGHAMSYDLISARYGSPNPTSVIYTPGYTGTEPIPGITLDPLSGQIEFTPTIAGNYTVVLRVTSFKPNGDLIGTVMNDIMFIVPACQGTAPEFVGLANAVNATIVGPNEIAVCEGTGFCVDLMFTDDDALSSMTAMSNVTGLFQGASLQSIGTDTLFATLCIPASATDLPFMAFIQASDDDCPIANTTSTFLFAQDCIILPVELISFDAEALTDRIHLSWSTGSEWNSSHFEMERADDAGGFKVLGTLPAAGSSIGTTNYFFDDTSPLPGTNFYRLKQIDLDGSVEISTVVIAMYNDEMGLELLPDGNGGWVVKGVAASSAWNIIDPLGRILHNGKADGSGHIRSLPGNTSSTINLLLIQKGAAMDVLKLPASVNAGHY